MTIFELREAANKIAHEARALLDTFTAENTAEKSVEFDKMMAESDALVARADKMEAVEKRQREFDAIAVDVPASTSEARAAEETVEVRFDRYLRGEISENELRAQAVGTAGAGGNLVPTSFKNELIVALKYYGPMLDDTVVNMLVTASGNPIALPGMDDTGNVGALLAENTAIAAQDAAFTQLILNAYKYHSKNVLVSSELMTDSAIDVQAIVRDALAERLGRAINAHLTTGTGTAQPQGVVTGASLGKPAAGTAAIAADELIDLIHSVDYAYRSNAKFMTNDLTVASVRKLKDSTGQYLWQPSFQAGVAPTLLGYPVLINNDMPTLATGAKTVLFGDFKKFTVRRVSDVNVKRLDERYADTDQVAFVGFLRVDGKVTDSRAIKYLAQA